MILQYETQEGAGPWENKKKNWFNDLADETTGVKQLAFKEMYITCLIMNNIPA